MKKEEKRFISLLSDYGFKAVFADESDTRFLRKAIQTLIQSDTPIKKVVFLTNEFVGITEKARGGLYDLICEDENKRVFIVEMQVGHYKYFIQRTKFYAFQKFNTMVKKGNYRFNDLTPIYCIGFLVESVFHQSKEYYHFGRLKNQKGEEMDSQISHVIVEIAKFDKQAQEITSDLDKLIYLMKNLEQVEETKQLPSFLTEDWIEQAMKKLDKSKMTPDQRMHYEMAMAKNASIIQMREDEIKNAEKRGEKRGKKETAQKLKEKGYDIGMIVDITDLTQEEIEKL